ncbi:phosphoinositide-interacting protein-like [Engraulis encrasicolus]|uniref:phosphoinositide-interacting protein-like n=1 Tax=Engraulis encrasicolus TaxID=184585 RepID=UPI002FD3BB2F
MLLTVADGKKTGEMETATTCPSFLKISSTLSPPKRRLWTVFRKPILTLAVGGLVFGAGTAASLLYFTQLGCVPYLVGPVLLSVGLMFLVTGLVWMPLIKQRLEHKALAQMNYSKLFSSEASVATTTTAGYMQPCASISQDVDWLA